jgi:hypothetical protein
MCGIKCVINRCVSLELLQKIQSVDENETQPVADASSPCTCDDATGTRSMLNRRGPDSFACVNVDRENTLKRTKDFRDTFDDCELQMLASVLHVFHFSSSIELSFERASLDARVKCN